MKYVAIDILMAESEYVTVEISYEDLEDVDPSRLKLFKYNPNTDSYNEFSNFTIKKTSKTSSLY